MSEHEYFDQLAAGHALNALEPAEELELTEHLRGCEPCRQVLAEHEFVAAQLGSLIGADQDADTVPSWSRIRAGVIPAGQLVPLDAARTRAAERARESRRGARRWVGAAAAALLVAGGLSTGLFSQGGAPSTQQQALRACTASSGCHLVQLGQLASLVVQGTEARLLPRRLHPAPPGFSYVLWQLPRDGAPTMVAVLNQTGDGRVGEQHQLALSYASTAAFGISLEPASAIPTHPTRIVAVGTA